MSFPRYPAYKDSGVEWLGEVPDHWTVDRIKCSVDGCVNGIWGDEPNGYQDIACIRVADFDRVANRVRLDEPTLRAVSEDKIAGRLLSRGDLLIEKSGGGDNQPVGCVVLFDHDMQSVCSNFVARMPVRKPFCASFLCYLHSTCYGLRINTKSIKQNTGIQNLDSAAYLNERVAFPPPHEQYAIADFLDCETAKIDTLVADYRTLIELLQEKRQAVISHAVTKGLDPTVPLKDSGVEWLGEVPEHWMMSRLKWVSPSITVGIVVNPSELISELGKPFIYGGDIAEGVIHFEKARRISDEDSLRNDKTILNPGDLLTVRVGAPGVTAVVPEECKGGNCASVMLTRRGDYDSRWLCFAMNSRMIRYQVENVQYGAAQEQFNIAHAINFAVIVPPRDEQEHVANSLQRETATIDSLITDAQEAITLLQERRTALISAAVTGKFDVCGLVEPEAA